MGHNTAAPRVLYLAYWGALDPLGQALLVPAVRGLAQRGAQITLVTWEKPELASTAAVAAQRANLRAVGITWLPLRYHHRPQAPATVLDVAQGVQRVLGRRGWRQFDIVHGRTFVGGLAGKLLAPLLGARFIFHAEGYWARERLDSGAWSTATPSFLVANGLEERLFDGADAVFCLSEAAASELRQRSAIEGRRTPVTVVPSSVDLEFFRVPDIKPRSSALRLIYVGTVGGGGATGPGVANRYRLDSIGRFVSHFAQRGRAVHLQVVSRAPQATVAQILGAAGLAPSLWSWSTGGRDEVRSQLAAADAGLHFMAPGAAAHAGSPTKVGEYWAMGLPVILTSGIGDTTAIAQNDQTGVVTGIEPGPLWDEAIGQLEELLADPDTPTRCRASAERCFDLERSCDEQMEVYRRMLLP